VLIRDYAPIYSLQAVDFSNEAEIFAGHLQDRPSTVLFLSFFEILVEGPSRIDRRVSQTNFFDLLEVEKALTISQRM
jgi:hypothetical protein